MITTFLIEHRKIPLGALEDSVSEPGLTKIIHVNKAQSKQTNMQLPILKSSTTSIKLLHRWIVEGVVQHHEESQSQLRLPWHQETLTARGQCSSVLAPSSKARSP